MNLKQTGRRVAATLTAVVMLTAIVLLVPTNAAVADQPVVIEDEFTFPDFDPCTGQPDLVTQSVVIKIHEHANTQILLFESTIETELGYQASGHETRVISVQAGHFKTTFNIMASHPETGARYWVKGRVFANLDDGPPVFGPPTFRCIGRASQS